MTHIVRACAAVAFVVTAGSAWAHHGMEAIFDLNQRFTVTGTLVRLDWRNPHVGLLVDAKIDQGTSQTWHFEGPPLNRLENAQAGRSDFENTVGKIVTVNASPARDGLRSGLIRIVV